MLPLPLINGALYVSSSFLETVQTCSRMSELYKLNARAIVTPTSALNFGKHIHSAMEMHYRLKEFNLSEEEVSQRVAALLAHEFEKSPNETDDFRTLNWAVELYNRYASSHRFENHNLLQWDEPRPCKYCSVTEHDKPAEYAQAVCPWCNGTGKSKIMCEVSFAIHLCDIALGPLTYFNSDAQNYYWKESKIGVGDALYKQMIRGNHVIPIYFHGYIDLPIERSGQYWTKDFKTGSQLGQNYWDDKRVSAQQKGYCWAFQSLTGLPITGHIVSAIRTASPPEWVQKGGEGRKRNGEPKKLTDWWNDALQEESFFLGDGELDEWKGNAIALVEEFFWHYSRGYFPKKTSWCAGKYGRCQYWDVCTTFPPKDRSMILESGSYKNKEQRIAK